MIDPKLLTPEAGFVEGCVVEIDWGEVKEWFMWTNLDDAMSWALEAMESIRPLTGPMAIWNFLPAKVKAVVFDEHGWPASQYFDNMPDIMMPRGAIYRPFWAKETK